KSRSSSGPSISGETMKLLRCAKHLVLGAAAALIMPGAALAQQLTLAPFNFTFNNPIGIDFQDTSYMLIMSVNYFPGTPHNLDLVDPTTGGPTEFTNISGLTNELKIATVRASTCMGGFADGEVFTGNGIAGQVTRISANGLTVLNPWVNLNAMFG